MKFTKEEILKKLGDIFGDGNAEEPVNAAKDMEARAQEAGLATKAIDAEAGAKALETVKALEETVKAQAEVIAALKAAQADTVTALAEIRQGQKAQAERAVKALDEVKGLLAQTNARPEPAPLQAEMKAAEEKTAAKIAEATAGGSTSSLALKRYTPAK